MFSLPGFALAGPARGRREQQGAPRGHAGDDDVEEAPRRGRERRGDCQAAFTSSLGRSRRRRTTHSALDVAAAGLDCAEGLAFQIASSRASARVRLRFTSANRRESCAPGARARVAAGVPVPTRLARMRKVAAQEPRHRVEDSRRPHRQETRSRKRASTR